MNKTIYFEGFHCNFVSVQWVGLSATPSRNFLLAVNPKLCYADLL